MYTGVSDVNQDILAGFPIAWVLAHYYIYFWAIIYRIRQWFGLVLDFEEWGKNPVYYYIEAAIIDFGTFFVLGGGAYPIAYYYFWFWQSWVWII